ncbi:MBL fold metallo-hydrolase [Maribacter hydrothermalis]|uniref:MBL fold metallo-hydrolase n=1 Tax=Maribacter hydrothermalis TaxID=1836467 RepID=A0A1B7ZFQ2_9FLAO|nr:MBL fold metallo-hydrolase [Maribacter hydrothermalis]OBR42397.1 MBL fold metallo-hydrolase [Maribacter hydrothermalis]
MKNVLIITVLFAAFSCKENKKESKDSSAAIEVVKPEVKLYTFDGGTVMVNNLELFSQDTTYQGQTKEFADPFYVISHPKGNLMWDAGLPEGLIAMGEPYTEPSGSFTVSRKDSVVNQLKSIGMSPADIKYIALSHTHFDHSGHANVFKDATWLVQKNEYDFITSEEAQKNNADLYNAIKELTVTEQLNGEHDVFGDGTVIIKSMPGHTPGHQVLYLDLAETGSVLLTGDLYHLYENRENRGVPIFNFNVEQTLNSMTEFEALAKENNARVIMQHSKEDFNKMPKAPEYLK